jgi:hypothetical protein
MLLFPKLILTLQHEDLLVPTNDTGTTWVICHLYLHRQTIQALVGGEAGLVVKCRQLRNVTADCYTVINLLVINM